MSKYYSNDQLQDVCRAKELDGSETDSIKANKVHSDLLKKKAKYEKDKEKKDLISAAEIFEQKYLEECARK